MNIHYVFQSFPEISQTFVFDQMRYLRKKGHNVSVSCRKLFTENMQLITCDFYDELHHLPDAKFKLPTFKNMLSKAPLRRNTQFTNSLAARFIEKSAIPDILVAHFGPNVLLASDIKIEIFKRINKNLPVVGVFHGYDLSRYIKKYGADRYKAYEKSIDLFVTISNYWKDLLLQSGIPEHKIKVIRLGVNPKLYNKKSATGKRTEKLISVGRMVEKKGFDDLIEAFAIIHKEDSSFSIDLIGDGPKLDELKMQVKNRGLDKAISFSGALSHTATLERIRNSDLFILASKTAQNGDKEGIPVVLMEAMASGVPVLSTYHSGIPELIEDGVSGVLVPERSPKDIATAIKNLTSDGTKLDSMTSEAYSVIEKLYNSEKQNRDFEEELIALSGQNTNF